MTHHNTTWRLAMHLFSARQYAQWSPKLSELKTVSFCIICDGRSHTYLYHFPNKKKHGMVPKMWIHPLRNPVFFFRKDYIPPGGIISIISPHLWLIHRRQFPASLGLLDQVPKFRLLASGLGRLRRSSLCNLDLWKFWRNHSVPYDQYCRRKFRSETSDNMDSWKAEVRRVRREKIRRNKMQMREKVGKSRLTVFFQWFVAPVGRKVGSLKRRVRSQLARWEMKNCTPLWREAHFQVKMYKTPQLRTTFGSWDVEKVHAVVARSTFASQNVQNTAGSDHFWKLRCRKSARRCGVKHISKSKCTKHTRFGPLLEVEMSKKCTPLWREAHFQVKSVKNWRSRTTFGGSDVEKVSKKCTPLWREAHFEVKSVKNWGFWAFFDVKMSKK